MSRVTKSELLEKNRLMTDVMVQIHNLTRPFVDLNANEPSKTVKVVEEVPIQRKPTTKTNKTVKWTQISAVPEQQPLLANEFKGNMAMRATTPAASDDSIVLSTSAEMNQNINRDEFIDYLGLQRITDSKKRKLNDTSAKANPEKKKPTVELNARVKVVIDRLSPMEIAKAIRRPTVPLGRVNNRPPQRQSYSRKAAPTNLKELTLLEIEKKFNQ